MKALQKLAQRYPQKRVLITGATAKGLQHDMETTSVTSQDIATSLLNSMARRRMYNLPQRDARLQWWLSRMFPETFRRFVLYLYRHQLWLFNTGE